MPVVLTLHGGGSNPTVMRDKTGWDQLADEHNFLAIYPAGTNTQGTDTRLYFNYGAPVKNEFANWGETDDVGFLDAILDDLAQFYSIDDTRVFASGISNGALMSYRFAAESNRVAAIAPVAGSTYIGQFVDGPTKPVPVIKFHGLEDEIFPYTGGAPGGLGNGQLNPFAAQLEVASVSESISSWLNHNQSSSEPVVTVNGDAVRRYYKGGDDGAPTALWSLTDGGHTWPGGTVTLVESLLGVGAVNHDIDASREMWDFFAEVTSAPGDYNRDFAIDAEDYQEWRDNFGLTGFGLAADGNGDEKIDTADFTIWRDAFEGQLAVSASADTSVPEPSGNVLALLGIAMMLRLRRRSLASSRPVAGRDSVG